MTGWWLASYIALWLLTTFAVIGLLVVLRQLGQIYLQADQGVGVTPHDGPEIGTTVPTVRVFDEIEGDFFDFPPAKSVGARLGLLVFVSPGCSICHDAISGVEKIVEEYNIEAVVASDGEEGASKQGLSLRSTLHAPVRYVTEAGWHHRLSIHSTPQAVVVAPGGEVLERQIVNDKSHVRALLDRALTRSAMARGR